MEKTVTITIKKWGINGEGIGYIHQKPIFVPGAIPQEIVQCTMENTDRKFEVATLKKVLQPSSLRRHRLCPIKNCDGCALMHVNYKGQCRMKEATLKQTLYKYAEYKGKILPIIKNESVLGYRNSCKMPVRFVDGKLHLGLYHANSNDFVPVSRCIVHQKGMEQVRQRIEELINIHGIKAYEEQTKQGLRTVVLKEFEEKVQIVLVTGQDCIPSSLIQVLSQIESVCSIFQSIKTDSSIDVFGKETKHLYGQKNMILHVHNLTLQLLPRSFFQLNTKQALRLYEYVESLVKPCRCIVEAYSGIGAMSLMTAHKAKKVIGIESIEDAVQNANENAYRNQLEHVSFICDDAGKRLSTLQETVDCLIVDPPRSGLDKMMKQAILDKKPKQMIYVSCNPSTLAKDLKELQAIYRIVSVQPFDIFSQTQHVETVVKLVRKDK